ncbi:GntR family transcriptional regulator [Cohnella sp. REN36]|uniref:GntR family transcriptional regulator n=1 Tax=Cohnella sp. REN36 TaxID=2887347 RepID=UPI001D14173D|nr:GntR family transcriptional regulator [Cohnella sp. REN36]
MHLALREAIVRGELAPGRRLLVLEIANALNISQAPVREALERLKQEGLLDSQSNKGSIVADVRKEEIEEIYALRELIELHAVRRCLPIRQGDMDALDALYSRMREAAAQEDHYRFIDLDMDFHRYFFARAGNRTILQLWDQLAVKLKRFMAVTNKLYFPDLISIAEGHLPLLAALKSGDEGEIERTLLAHMNEVWWRMDKGRTHPATNKEATDA